MNRLYKLSYILIIIVIMIPISRSNLDDIGTSLSDETVDNYKKDLDSDSGSSSQDRGDSNSVKYYYTNTAANAIEINQFTDYSLIEDGLPIYGEVGIIKEIRNSLTKEIKGLTICERIDENADLIKEPVCYLSYFGNKSSKIMSDLRDNISIDVINDTSGKIQCIIDDERTRSFYIPYLGAKGRIIIYYRIMAKSVGLVQLGTSARFNEKDYRDNDYYFKYKSELPIKVIPNVLKTKLFSGIIKPPDTSSTSIIYELEYMNWSGKAGDKLIKIYLEKKSEYYNIKSSFIDEYKLGSNRTLDKDYGYQIDNDKIKFSLPFGKNCKLKFDIEYFNEGENSIPAIFLDDVRFQDNSVKILVEDYLNAQTSVFYLIIINILMLCATLYINKINNDKSIRMLNEHKNAHLFQIDASANSIQKEIGQIKNNLSTLNDKMKRVDDLVYLKDIALEMKKINRKLK